MEKFCNDVGVLVTICGGFLLCIAIVLFLGWLVLCAWVIFSNQFREICKCESMIFEYRKYREQFLAWLEMKDGGKDG